MRSVAHIVNICAFPQASEHHSAQAVTLETMRIAARFAEGTVAVRLLSAQFPEDRVVVPEFFSATPDLERSVLDVAEFGVKRKLPLIKDILDRAHDATEAEFLIYSNIDIGLLPHFYGAVNRLIDTGLDAFIINRRSLPRQQAGVSEIPLLWSTIGTTHMGYDCFIFRRDTFVNFALGLACVGAPHVGKILFANQLLNSQRFSVLRDLHLTFHNGNERSWRSRGSQQYADHNKAEFAKLMAELRPGQAAKVRRALRESRSEGLIRKVAAALGLRA